MNGGKTTSEVQILILTFYIKLWRGSNTYIVGLEEKKLSQDFSQNKRLKLPIV